jgi:hypothetical protein
MVGWQLRMVSVPNHANTHAGGIYHCAANCAKEHDMIIIQFLIDDFLEAENNLEETLEQGNPESQKTYEKAHAALVAEYEVKIGKAILHNALKRAP